MSPSETDLKNTTPSELYDLLIIGGGINGAGIARDATGRGLKVLMVEKEDLAQHTSSASTKLIHGGLRYLEYYEFRLVREALMERERLMKIAPHIIWPMHFVMPYFPSYRPAWMLRMGLFLYDHIGGRISLPKSKSVRLRTSSYGAPLNGQLDKGFVYSDCGVMDSRLVVLNAMSAAEQGCDVRLHTQFISAQRHTDRWDAVIQDVRSGRQSHVQAKIIVNAAGPWVNDVIHQELNLDNNKSVKLVKGSHIVVPRMFEGEQSYILQNPDKRIVFAIPYEENFTLIGTTDLTHSGPPGKVDISEEETVYLCDAMNRYFKQKISKEDVVWSYAGLRPLFDDGSQNASAMTRDYTLDVDTEGNKAPLLSIFGGKITTYRRLAEHALEKLQPFLPGMNTQGWTADKPLPGGEYGPKRAEVLKKELWDMAPFLEKPVLNRLYRQYGTRAKLFLHGVSCLEDLGENFGHGLTAREVDYLIEYEWVHSAEDILWRRSRLGLHLSAEQKARLENYVQNAIEKRAN